MKKWNEPQVVELGLEKTEDSECNVDFESIGDTNDYSAHPIFGCKYPDAYQPGITGWKCIYYKDCKCTYVPTGGQS